MNTIIRNIMGTDVTITPTIEEINKITTSARIENSVEDIRSMLAEKTDPEYDVDNIPDELVEEIAKDYIERMNDLKETLMGKAIQAFRSQLEEYEKKDKVFTVEVTLTMKKEYTVRAKDENDAERIFTAWSERNSRRMTDDLTDDAEYIGEWDTDGFYEDDSYDPEEADVSEGDI